jgi:uncharacterized membrane protein YukC
MNSIDISDLAFSLDNIPAVHEILSCTNDSITDVIPEFIINTISEPINTNIASDIIYTDNICFLYLGIGLIIIVFFIYIFFVNKNKHVSFNDNVEKYYQSSNNQRSDF